MGYALPATGQRNKQGSPAMTIRASIMRKLIAELVATDDRANRERIAAEAEQQYYLDMVSQANYVQYRIGDIEIGLRDQLTQTLGATNDMISEAIRLSREGSTAVVSLRSDF